MDNTVSSESDDTRSSINRVLMEQGPRLFETATSDEQGSELTAEVAGVEEAVIISVGQDLCKTISEHPLNFSGSFLRKKLKNGVSPHAEIPNFRSLTTRLVEFKLLSSRPGARRIESRGPKYMPEPTTPRRVRPGDREPEELHDWRARSTARPT